ECDDANADNTDDCTELCLQPTCGDGYTWAGNEECDDAGESAACDADCTAAACGDGLVNAAAGEACDDGNDVNEDACTAACQAAACGDGFVQAGEECDDANMADGDGCSASCTSELNAQCMQPYNSFNLALRHVNNANGPVGCDSAANNDWLGAGWYRFTGGAGAKMPESPPATYRCGTHATGWLNGAHPAVNEGVAARTVCFHWNGNQCYWSAPIQVVNCDGFYLYSLPVPPACSLRYCGEG
ncbi:MAG: DUF4215 domain-containing protein, partial [Myxococcales bacterium]|nr:DUF4215 domain-containing protein [Myxococcales bacterium]